MSTTIEYPSKTSLLVIVKMVLPLVSKAAILTSPVLGVV